MLARMEEAANFRDTGSDGVNKRGHLGLLSQRGFTAKGEQCEGSIEMSRTPSGGCLDCLLVLFVSRWRRRYNRVDIRMGASEVDAQWDAAAPLFGMALELSVSEDPVAKVESAVKPWRECGR